MKSHTKNILLIILVIVAGIMIYQANHKVIPLEVVTDTQPGTVETPSTGTQTKFCYFKETKGQEGSDLQFISINYDANQKAHGIINWLPAEKDTLIGTYTGTVEKNDLVGYPTRLNITYAGTGEGMTSYQQEIIAVGANDIKQAVGDKQQGADNVWYFKSTNNLQYQPSVPLVDCSTVPERASKDYTVKE